MKNTSLKSAILIPVTIVLVAVIVAEVILLGSLSAKEAGTLTANIVQEAVSHYAADFESTGVAPYSAVLAVAPVIKDLARSDNGREQAGRVLQAVLAENDDFTSIWTCWEPNAFDGKDSQYRGKANHDGTGRFALNVYRNSTGIYSEVLTQYDTGDFYLGAKQTKQVYVTDPYFYNQGGKEVVLYSITVPVLENGVFVGAVGIEVDLDKVSAKMNGGSLLKEGYVFTLSPGGIITTHPSQDYLMVHYKNTWMQQYDQRLQELSRVEGRFTEKNYSTVLGKDILLAVENVEIGDTGRYWTICGVVPQTAVLRSSYFLIKVLTGVSVLLVVFVLVTIRAIINKRLHELPQILKMADSLVAGEVEDITVERCETTEKSMKNEIRLIELAFQRIARTTKEQVEILQRIAAGDLSVQVTPNSQRDLLNQALKELLESNNTVFKQIVLSAQQVEVGASQMADGAQLLAQASMEQTTSIERLTRSLGEIAEEAGRNEEIANNAAEMSNGIAKIAQQGTGHMEQMIRAVSEINEASKSINSVIKVIDDIAFQTNILALNAAVEAARAGQYGKGFAVVAEEVRSLAAKSAEAAKDTNRLIKNSIEKAELGASIATETAEILDQIAQGIDESSQAVAGIVPLARNQGNGIKTVNHGIEQIVQAAQQNSAIAEESAAGSEQMRGQARLLKDMVAQFKLKDGPERPLPLYEPYNYDADIDETAFKL